MERKPLVLDGNGNVTQLQPGDTLDARAKEVDSFGMINEDLNPIVKLSPVYISSSANVKPAQANAPATSKVIGLAVEQIAPAANGSIQTDGWDGVTGQTGGLTPGATYFLDEANPGKLRVTAPTSGSLVVIGDALSDVALDLNVEKPILL